MKRIISLISFVLVLVMLAGPAAAFKDFPGENQYDSNGKWERYVKFDPQCGWKGYPDGTFHPNEKITRAEFVCYLYQFYQDLFERTYIQIDPIRKYNKQFSDVPTKSWYYTSVVWAYERGFINGAGGGKFDPKSTISVFEYAIIMKRFYDAAFTKEYYDYLREYDYEVVIQRTIVQNYNYSYRYYYGKLPLNNPDPNSISFNKLRSIIDQAVLIKMPTWFKKETTIEEILKHDIWIGGSGEQVDMTQFSPTRGELYKHTHYILESGPYYS